MTLGNATADDITITGSLAATINIKTNNSFNIGSAALGLAGVFLGAPSGRSTRVTAHQSLGGSNTLVLPDGNGTSRYYIETDGSGNLSWNPVRKSSGDKQGYSIATSVASSILTITVKGANGSSFSSTNWGTVVFRNVTAATGTPIERELTADISMEVSSGSTLGHTSGANHPIYVYLLDNAGTIELGVSSKLFEEGSVASSSAEGGAGGADTASTLYSTTGRTNVPIRLIGRMKSNQTTAGTWAAVPTEISLGPTPAKFPTFTGFSSGSGTYVVPFGVRSLRVRLVGGGGGGGGSGTTAGTGATGGDTTFGTLTGSGGSGAAPGAGGAGVAGTSTNGDVNITGGRGTGAPSGVSSAINAGVGGGSVLGFGGPPGITTEAGLAATGYGGGGGGASNNASTTGSPGGSGGGYCEKNFTDIALSYSYGVGALGAGGTAGTNGHVGGAGTAGIILIEEFY